MRVGLGWLSEWVDLPASREELEDRLTVGGLEIEEVIQMGPSLDGLVVGHVRQRVQHPDADRLSVCTVDLGGEAPVEIVCGAPNVAAGQAVAVAPHGTVLPDGTKIKRGRIRGVKSNGMICSSRELGLGDDHDGILVLETDAAAGTPLAEAMPPGETVLDMEITPNRGDWVSMLGMAREVRAHYGGALRMPDEEPPEDGPPAADAISVAIDDGAGCHRYVARIVRDVRVGPSPAWLVDRLEAAGLRPVNNVVDVTNLVMLEYGQPLHAFDLERLRGGQIGVRAAHAAEKIETLDGEVRELLPEDLLIVDGEGPVAVAGVMGGADSEVSDATTALLIESAHFEPSRVRRTARRLGLHSDASYRFERGVDPEGQARAADRAARLIQEIAGGTVAKGRVEALGETPARTAEIVLDPARANRLLGTALSGAEMVALLGRVDVEASEQADGSLRCTPPSYRNDLHLPVDLVEEVARIYGYGEIDEAMPEGTLGGISEPPDRSLREAVRDALVGAGLVEVMTFPASPPDDADALRLPEDDPRRPTLQLVNPITSNEPTLRATVVPGLLRLVRGNLARQVDRFTLFELSRVFRPGEGLPAEPLEAAAAVVDAGEVDLWGAGAPVFFQAKGMGERLFAQLEVEARFEPGGSEPFLHPGACGTFRVGSQDVASVGEIHPEVAARFDIETPTALLVVDVAGLLAVPRRRPHLEEVSRHPHVRRDLAVLLDRGVAAGEVLEAIRKRGGGSLRSARVFDRYEGKGVPEGKVSLAFRLVFQRADRTLLDSEVSKAVDRVVHLLEERFGGELR